MLGRGGHGAALCLRWTLEGGSLSCLQKGADTLDGGRTGLAASPQIENKAWIADSISPEASWCGLAPIQELLHFTK